MVDFPREGHIIGASLSEPHIVVLFRMSVHPVGVCPTSGVRLAYDRMSKWKIVMLRHPAGSPTRVQVAQHNARQYTESSLLCFTPVLQTTYYRLVESCRGQLEGEILSASGGKLTPLSYRLYQSHAQLFRCLLYVACSTASDEKMGVGLGTRLKRTWNCRPSTMNDNWLHRRPHLPL